mmetsp:Transcript_15075/g.18383  ORF Transcript_15075/g.18383 Transcript_15075/m.18383 type:complete len:136 (+) Transcript_15075:200-607(+)
MADKKDNPLQSIKDMLSKSNELPSLKDGIQVAVNKTNGILETLEAKKHRVDHSVDLFASSRVRPIMSRIYVYIERGVKFYQLRQYYGPQIIGASVATVGALVTARRGKIPGLFTSAFTGAGSYTFVYGIPKFNLP